jgi:ribosome-associated protein
MKKLTTPAKKKLVISALEDIKAHDILAIDVRKVTPIFDWIVVASADSSRQTKALARHVQDTLRQAGSTVIGTEGEDSGEWVLVDFGDVVAHVMQPAVREYYNLEELWGEGKFDAMVNSTVPVARAHRAKAAVPVKKRAVPVKKRAVPVKKRAVPVKKRAVPVKRRAVPVKRRAVPVKKRAAPGTRAKAKKARRKAP